MAQGGPIDPVAVYGSAGTDVQAPDEYFDGDYDSGDVDKLLITLLNTPSLARRCAKWFNPEFLQTYLQAEVWQVVVWTSLRDLLLQSQVQFPDPEYLARAAHHTALRTYGDESIGELARTCVLSIHGIEPMPEVTKPIIEFVYNKCVMNPNMQALMMEAKDATDWNEVQKRIEDINLERSRSIVDEKATQSVDPFGVLDRLDKPVEDEAIEELDEHHRIKTGVEYIDAVHGGKGLYRGFTTLVAGPTGGGKTVVNYELISKLTSQGYSVGLFATEEDPSTDMEARARLWAACSDVKVGEWIDAKCDPRRLASQPPPAQIDRLRSIRSSLKVYRLELVTWSALIAELDTYFMLNKERMHDVVIIDWAGPLALDMVANGECRSDHEALERICYWSTINIARKYQCAVVVFHQLADAAVAKKGIFGKYGKGDTQNCHKMSQHCAAMHVITPRDKSGRGRYCGVKARFDPPDTEVVIKLDYDHGRFMDYIGTMTASNGRFMSKNNDKASRMVKGRSSVGDD